jgi:ComEC/Rec2-related protein
VAPPVLIYATLYVGGICVGESLPTPPLSIVCVPVVLALLLGLVAWHDHLRVATWLAAITALVAGAVGHAVALAPGEWDPSHLPAGTEVALHGSLARDPAGGRGPAKTVLRVWAGKVGDEILPLRGTVVVEAVRPPDDDASAASVPKPLQRLVPRAGDEVVVVGRITPFAGPQPGRRFDAGRSAARRHGAFVRVRHAAVIELPRVGPPSIGDLRHTLIARNLDLSPDRNDGIPAAVMQSMVFGSASTRLPDETLEAFRRAGTIHVLVVSGSQVVLLATLVAWFSGWVRLSRRWTLCLSIAVAIGYAVLLPTDGSILRAVILFGTLYVGKLFLRDPDTATSVGLAAFQLLLVYPGRLWDVSLQLSVLAVLGVIYGVRLLSWDRGRRPRPGRWARFGRYTWGVMAGSIGATLATLPLISTFTGTVALASPVANLVSVPIAVVLTPLALASTVLAWIVPPVARVLNEVGALLADALIAVTTGIAWPVVQSEPWPTWVAAAVYAGLGALVWWGEGRRRARKRLGERLATDREEPAGGEPNQTPP